MRSLEKRLADLERGFHCDPIILEMPDGSTKTIIVGSGDGLLDLFGRSMQELEAGAGFSRDVDTIRRSGAVSVCSEVDVIFSPWAVITAIT
jgi:hypothetical protein